MRFPLSSVAASSWVRSHGTAVMLAAVGVGLAWGMNLATVTFETEQYVYQAHGFLHGSSFFIELPPSARDVSHQGAAAYWPLAPLPAVLLVPLVALFGIMPWQTMVNFALVPFALFLAYKLGRRTDYAAGDALWLSLAFVFASVYVGVTLRGASWQFGSAVGGLLALGAACEHLGRRRPWLTGLMAAGAFLARPTAGLATLIFLVLAEWWSGVPIPEKRRRLAVVAVPVVVAGILWGGLNFLRTGRVTDSGYLSADINRNIADLRERYGLFSLANIPTNLYYYFLSGPLPLKDPITLHLAPPYIVGNFSMSFFLLSPIFLWAFAVRRPSADVRAAAWAAGVTVAVLLSYYSVNVHEVGPRYLIDVLPFLFLMLLWRFRGRPLPTWAKGVIGASMLLNLYLSYTLLAVGVRIIPI